MNFQHGGNGSSVKRFAMVAAPDDCRNREATAHAVLADAPVSEEDASRTQESEVVQSLNDRNTAVPRCIMNRRQSQWEEIVNVQDVRAPGLDLPLHIPVC